jgi:hypothetical protein
VFLRDYRRPPSDQGEFKPREAATGAAAQPVGAGSRSRDSGRSVSALAERHEPRWRDIKWVDFTSDSASGSLPQPAVAPTGLPPAEASGLGDLLRHFVRPAPDYTRDKIPGLAARFARLPVLRAAEPAPTRGAPPPPEIAPVVARSPGTAVTFHPRTPTQVAAIAEPEPAPREPPALAVPDAPAAVEMVEYDEDFPASIMTPVGTRAEPLAPRPSIAATLAARLEQAGAGLRRHGAGLSRAGNAGLTRAGTALRTGRPHRQAAPIGEPPPVATVLPAEPELRVIVPPSPRAARPSRVAIVVERTQAAARRLTGTHRRMATTALAVLGVALAAYVGGELLTRALGTSPDSLPIPSLDRPVQSLRSTAPQPRISAPVQPESQSDPAARAAFYLDRAKAGDPAAQYDLGVLYARGNGLVEDLTSAASWFRAAAAQGNVAAQYNLGVLYERGVGVPQNATEAANWYRSAADQNHPGAQYNLALAYADGSGANQDFAAAARWYQRAAQQGLVPAMVNLAILYESGKGVGRSPIDAYAWYGAAAERGDTGAKERAGELFRQFTDQEKARAQGLAATIAAAVNGAPPPA